MICLIIDGLWQPQWPSQDHHCGWLLCLCVPMGFGKTRVAGQGTLISYWTYGMRACLCWVRRRETGLARHTVSLSVCQSVCQSLPVCQWAVGSGQWAVGSSTPSVWWAFTACRRDRNQASDPLRSFLLRLVFFKTLFKWLITFSSFKPSLSIAWSSERTFASKVLMLLGGPPY